MPWQADPVELRRLSPAGDDRVVEVVLRLQRAAYAVEAQLLADDRIPPLHEDAAALVRADLHWLGAFRTEERVGAEELVGAVAWRETDDEVDLHRLMVAPHAHRAGIGAALVRAVLVRAGARRTIVATGRDNVPAVTLYQRLGFDRSGEHEPVPGLWVTHFVHPGTGPRDQAASSSVRNR